MTPYEHDLVQQICNAIKNKNLIRFFYSDTTKDNVGWRTVEPFLVGISKTDKVQLSGWFHLDNMQILSGEEQGWRLYIVSHIQQLSVLTDKFVSIRPFYNPQDKRMKAVLCCV